MYGLIFEKQPENFLKKLDKSNQIRVFKKIGELRENPKIGVPLMGNLVGLWKLRIRDFRVIYQIKEEKLVVLILKLGHRKNVYG